MDAWPISRDDEGMPIIRAIRTILATLPRLRTPLLEIINRDLERKIESSPKDGGTILVDYKSFRRLRKTRICGTSSDGNDDSHDDQDEHLSHPWS